MPIYEYQCEQCGETAEILQKFSDAPLSYCPDCGGQMHKLISMNSFQLKGSGWYVTDYAGKNNQTVHNKSDADSKKADVTQNKDGAEKPKSRASAPAENKSASGCQGGCDKPAASA